MNPNKHPDNVPNAGPQLVPVHFEFTHQTPISVCIVGCFNHGQPEAKTLHPAGGGRGLMEPALAPGPNEYCLVVDAQWMPDPLAKRPRTPRHRRPRER